MASMQHGAPVGVILSREAVRRVDHEALERYGLPGIVLMENAAIGLAAQVSRFAADRGCRRLVIVCGPGNNGGDGYAAARHLHNGGFEIDLVATAPPRTGSDAAINEHVIRRMGLPISDDLDTITRAADAVLVDAVVGTGLVAAPTGTTLRAIEALERGRAAAAGIVAVDLPSGLDADSGRPLGACVTADLTVTFAALKPGLVAAHAQRWFGRVEVVSIGAPRALIEGAARDAS